MNTATHYLHHWDSKLHALCAERKAVSFTVEPRLVTCPACKQELINYESFNIEDYLPEEELADEMAQTVDASVTSPPTSSDSNKLDSYLQEREESTPSTVDEPS